MRSLKSGVVSVVFASVVGMAAVIGCSASGSSDDDTTVDPATPTPVATLPPGSGSSSGDTPPADAGKKDAAKVDSGVDAGPPPPVAGDPCPTANVVKSKSCGICGTQTTICLDDGSDSSTSKKWSDYSSCSGELAGGCTPGVTQACGNCGMATCNQYCAFNSCSGQPANSCSPGDVTLLSAGCNAGTYRQEVCSATCTLGNASLTCEAPPTFVTVPAAVGAVTSGVVTLSTTTTIGRISGGCPATIQTDAMSITPYAYFEVRNTTGKAVTVDIYESQFPGGPIPDMIIAAYAGATPPTTTAQRKACLTGIGDFGTTALTGDSNFGSLDPDNDDSAGAVTIAAGASVTVYAANYFAPDPGNAASTAVGLIKLNVKTLTIAP